MRRFVIAAGLAAATALPGQLLAQESTPPVPRDRPSVEEGVQMPAEAPADDGTVGHVLIGEWTLLWLSLNRSHSVTIEHAFSAGGMTNLVGHAIGDQTGNCPLTGYVVDEFVGELRDGFDIRTVPLSALVRLRIQCPTEEIRIDAFGLPDGPVLISGRAMLLLGDGSRIVEAVAMGRADTLEPGEPDETGEAGE